MDSSLPQDLNVSSQMDTLKADSNEALLSRLDAISRSIVHSQLDGERVSQLDRILGDAEALLAHPCSHSRASLVSKKEDRMVPNDRDDRLINDGVPAEPKNSVTQPVPAAPSLEQSVSGDTSIGTPASMRFVLDNIVHQLDSLHSEMQNRAEESCVSHDAKHGPSQISTEQTPASK